MASYNIKVIKKSGRPTNYERIIEAYAMEVIMWFQNYMLRNNRIATGDSIKSFELLVLDNEVVINAKESVAFAIGGRKPGPWPNIQDISDWIVAKKLVFEKDPITGRTPTLQQLTFLISRKIANDGTNPPKLNPQNISAVVTGIGTKYTKRIGEATAKAIADDIRNTFKRSRIYKVK